VSVWPSLDLPRWLDTATTLHMWTQIIGKTRLALEPMQNHWWQVPLYVTPVGLTTPLLTDGDRGFDIELDLTGHALRVRDARGRTAGFPLAPMSVATFWARYRAALARLDVVPHIRACPVEVVQAIPFDEDETHASYDPAWAAAFATALRSAHAILAEFRGGFVGKCSPVHFFWGGFDLAVTRFSGRTAPPHPGGIPNCPDRVMTEAYSHEVSSAGFWPGSAEYGEAAFYAYAYPQPDGFERAPLAPAAARWDATLREFILPYEAVRRAADPRADLRAFLDATYVAAAELAHWDRNALERR
jgi:hypothetical protein